MGRGLFQRPVFFGCGVFRERRFSGPVLFGTRVFRTVFFDGCGFSSGRFLQRPCFFSGACFFASVIFFGLVLFGSGGCSGPKFFGRSSQEKG